MFRIAAILALLAGCTPFPEEPPRPTPDVGPPAEDLGGTGGDTDSEPVDTGDTGPDIDTSNDADTRHDGETCRGDDDCDDGQFCNGPETCSPGSETADAFGCVPGVVPDTSDGIACTADGCDEASDTILHDPSACSCQRPGQRCACADHPGLCDALDACQVLMCSDQLECAPARAPPETRCDDGALCTADDVCGDDGVCRGTASDEVCNNGRWCDGVERCAPEQSDLPSGCMDAVPPVHDERVACTVDRCVECDEIEGPCEPGLEGRWEHTPGEDCECIQDADCSASACQVASCDAYECEVSLQDPGVACDDGDPCTQGTVCDADGACVRGSDICDECRNNSDCAPRPCHIAGCDVGQCVYRLAPNDATCESLCPGVPEGRCWDGACVLAPEGPVGTDDCVDGEDNDCDGVIDADDAGCFQAEAVLVSGVGDAEAGLDASGAALAVVHLRDVTPLSAQRRNTYCVAHRLHYEQTFDEPGAIEQDPQLTVGGQQTPASGVTAADGSVGLRLCSGELLALGPLTLPPVGNPGDTFMVELEVARDAETPFFDLDHLFVAWRSDLLEPNTHVAALAAGPGLGVDGTGRYRFLVSNHAGMNAISVRLGARTSNGNRCAVLDALRVYQVPHLAQPGADPTARTYLNWRYGNTTEPAWQPFEAVALDAFLAADGDRVTYALSDEPLYGAHGMEFATTQGADISLVGLPPFANHPEVERSNPLVFDAALGISGPPVIRIELFNSYVSDSQGQLTLVASAMPTHFNWLVHPMQLAHPAAPAHRSLVVLPESFKVRDTGSIVLAGFSDEPTTRNLMDDVHVYWFTHPATRDVTVEHLQSWPADTPVNAVRVRSQQPGTVRVRCYWQVPDDDQFTTVESETHEIVFE